MESHPSRGQSSRKRPNQAQRRQMTSQLSIDIDPRATEPQFAAPRGQRGGAASHYHHPQTQSGAARGGYHDRGQSHPPVHNRPFSHHQQQQQQPRQGFGHRSLVSPTYGQPTQQSHWNNHPAAKDPAIISAEAFVPRSHHQGSLYNAPGYRQYNVRREELDAQSSFLEQLCIAVVGDAEIELSEIAEKEKFRVQVEEICRAVIDAHEIENKNSSWAGPQSVQLKCFGSLSSGFATKTADMDLGLLSSSSLLSPDTPESPVPRLLEKALLDAGFGARLLTRTRVPIIKLCEKPTDKLRSDLLEERAKWEKGLTDGESADAEDDPGADDAGIQEKANATSDGAIGRSNDSPELATSESPQENLSDSLASLKQSDNQSLAGYHSLAKKVLRRLNGRDLTHSNIDDFEDADFMLLDDLCIAFVNGLYDEELRERVRNCHAFSPGKHVPNFKSLQGVFNLVVGERFVLLHNRGFAFPAGSVAEETYLKHFNHWMHLRDTRTFGSDPLLLSRDLHIAVERLRQVPGLQLMLLQQDQYESSTTYHLRAAKIIEGLLPRNATESQESAVIPKLPEYYISGIWDADIRRELEAFAQSNPSLSFRDIARKHKCLHLASQYSKALDGSHYNKQDIQAVADYTSFLRSDTGDQVPETLVSRIRSLPDPSRMQVNRPRDRYHDKLEFPKSGVGVQCDINFSAHLALQNTLLLRCYSYCDSRVRPLVLFVKHWAKARGINTPYRGTLSSYGYVLMVIHYLVNVAHPFVCPNLQLLAPPDPDLPPEALEGIAVCKGRNVRFWRDEQEILRMAQQGAINRNRESLGFLLRGFFEYYAQNNMMSATPKRGFDWGRDVISLRTPDGLLSKHEKGWISAKTVLQVQGGAPPTPTEVELMRNPTSPAPDSPFTPNQDPSTPMSPVMPTKPEPNAKPKDFKEIRHRYLFAIEDPFELEHNVARTVTHNGIVSIRDEFRRAWRIIKSAGKFPPSENILEDAKLHSELLGGKQFDDLLKELHGLNLHK
ncbi:terpene cyclase atmB [Apiospora sp. TS-2023a]